MCINIRTRTRTRICVRDGEIHCIYHTRHTKHEAERFLYITTYVYTKYLLYMRLCFEAFREAACRIDWISILLWFDLYSNSYVCSTIHE